MSALGPLTGIRILDLTRVLAGPTCTQMLGDLGADVIKIERPGAGDDTRGWGPPFLHDRDGRATTESAYFISANRNKRSVTIDIASAAGCDVLLALLVHCDVLVENFKVGDLQRYGLAWSQLRDRFPKLVYCSITGFGQSGPYASRAGYDFLAQGMSGLMSLTGTPDGEPMKVGIGNADLVTGLYAAVAIVAALRSRDISGGGQHIDLGLLDCQLALMTYEAENFLVSGQEPQRRGNAHPNIVPYEVFAAADGHLILAVGNDAQFAKFCCFAGHSELSDNPDFATNAQRVINREKLIPILRQWIAQHSRQHWLEGLEALQVPCGPVATLPEALANEQILERNMVVPVDHPDADGLRVLASPMKFSLTPTSVRRAPPLLGQHTTEVLGELLGYSATTVAELRKRGAI